MLSVLSDCHGREQAVAMATVSAVMSQLPMSAGGGDWVPTSKLRAVEAEAEELRRRCAAQQVRLEQAEQQVRSIMAGCVHSARTGGLMGAAPS